MTPRRIDRAAVRARLDDVPVWIQETLLDAFEPAALSALNTRAERDKPKGKEPSSVDRAAASE